MRHTAAVKRRPPAVVSQGVPLPAPTGGWDAISPLANMPADRAIQLDNWVPRPGWIEPRNGFIQRNANVGGIGVRVPVQTVMAYNGFNQVNKLFAVAGGNIYDVTTIGAAVAGPAVSNNRLQWIQFSNASYTQYIIAVNGVDAPFLFDGTTWTSDVITGTGVTQSSFIQVASHKGRLWFVQANSTNPVYMDTVGAISGSATVFPLGQLMTKGGYVVAIGTWTVDTRQNVDEYIAFITSRGQVIVYAGTDPSTANTWSLVGSYNIGRPIGARCFSRISGDLLIITMDGVVGMSEMLSTDRAAANRVSLTSVIMNQMALAARQWGTNFGWEVMEYAKSELSILNVPIAENSQQVQYVMNTLTGAWCQFIGIDANCWVVDANDNIYFGDNRGNFCQWDVGSGDNGLPIVCTAKGAYNAFGNAPQLKRYTLLQTLITTTGLPIPSVGIDVDFKGNGILSTEEPFAPVSPLWNQVNWNQFSWPSSVATTDNWISVNGMGHYVSVITQVVTQPNLSNPSATITLQLNGWNITAESGAFV